MNTCLNLKVMRLPVLALLAIFSVWCVIENAKPSSCTIFTAARGETVLFGNNEDWHNPNPMIGFFPPSAAGFGSVHFGHRDSSGQINFEGAVNDQGLAWDINSTPRFKLNPYPEKPYYLGTPNYLTTITKEAASVEEAIEIARKFEFGDSFSGQIHVADAAGNAVVISAGPDGEMAFTRKAAGDGYLVSTNFNLAIPEKGPVDFRYDTANSMLEKTSASQALTPEFAGEILEAVHLKTLTTHTLYSNVNDLQNGNIYLYYMAQYDEVVTLDMAKELLKGQRVVEMRSLFAPATVEAGDSSYRQFELRFRAAQVAAVAVGLALITGVVVIVVKKLNGRPNLRETRGEKIVHLTTARPGM
jgi:hypothetical protein